MEEAGQSKSIGDETVKVNVKRKMKSRPSRWTSSKRKRAAAERRKELRAISQSDSIDRLKRVLSFDGPGYDQLGRIEEASEDVQEKHRPFPAVEEASIHVFPP